MSVNRAPLGRGRQRPPPPEPGRGKRRWPRRLALTGLILVCVLAVLVGLAPHIASTKAVTGYVLSIANDQLLGTIRVGDLSLSWGGPLEVHDLEVLDPSEREVLRVSKIAYAGGVWKLLTSAEDFGEISIDAPRINLYVTSDDEITLAQAFQQTSTVGAQARAGGQPVAGAAWAHRHQRLEPYTSAERTERPLKCWI